MHHGLETCIVTLYIVVTTSWLEQGGRQFIGLHYCMLLSMYYIEVACFHGRNTVSSLILALAVTNHLSLCRRYMHNAGHC